MPQTKYAIYSNASDGINGLLYSELAEAQSAIQHHYGNGEFLEVAPAGDRGTENAFEFFIDENGESVARIEPIQHV